MTDRVSDHIIDNILCVVVKPNSPRTEVLSYDGNRKCLRIAVAAVPDKDKANTELLKFLKRQTGRRCTMISGARSREKKIRFL